MYWPPTVTDLLTKVEVLVLRVVTEARRVRVADINLEEVDTKVQTAYRFIILM